MMEASFADGGPVVLGTVGRKRISFATPDASGQVNPTAVRHYDAATTTTVSGALTLFQRDMALPSLPSRAAFAVAGLVRGDTISVTRTRWYVSRPGLAAMLGRPPLILNDFAAEAWGVYGADTAPREVFAGSADFTMRRPGCYAVVGITSGLGFAIVAVDAEGRARVLPTEAGHGALVMGCEEVARAAAELFPRRHSVAAEEMVSAPGLLAIYGLLARRAGVQPRAHTPEDVTRTQSIDPLAREACELLCKAFWAQAGSLVLGSGAWDGLVVIGKVAEALRPILRRADVQARFAGTGKHAAPLTQVPRILAAQDNGCLRGLAEALRHA